MSITIDVPRTHQTLLVIDARNGIGNKNRVNRLLESVNGDNIKVDIAHIRNGDYNATGIQAGLPPELTGSGVANTAVFLDDIVSAGKANGWAQVIVTSA